MKRHTNQNRIQVRTKQKDLYKTYLLEIYFSASHDWSKVILVTLGIKVIVIVEVVCNCNPGKGEGGSAVAQDTSSARERARRLRV